MKRPSCVCVCVCACARACVHACMRACVHARVVCTLMCQHVHVWQHMHVRTPRMHARPPAHPPARTHPPSYPHPRKQVIPAFRRVAISRSMRGLVRSKVRTLARSGALGRTLNLVGHPSTLGPVRTGSLWRGPSLIIGLLLQGCPSQRLLKCARAAPGCCKLGFRFRF